MQPKHVEYIQTRAFDKFPYYYRCPVTALGLIQVIAGLLSMALGVGAICTFASGYYIGYGIWCGFVFTLTGSICIGSAMRKSACMIVSALILSLVSTFCGVVQLSIGIVAADNDAVNHRRDTQLGYDVFSADYDIYYEKNNPYYYYCSGPNNPFTWANAWGPVDVLLLLTGFIAMVAAICNSAFGCHAACRGKRVPALLHYPYPIPQTAAGSTIGFTNDAYMTEARMSPPLYKLTA